MSRPPLWRSGGRNREGGGRGADGEKSAAATHRISELHRCNLAVVTTLAIPVWRTTNRSTVDHAIRGDHTLCGIDIGDQDWHPTAGRVRCDQCAAVPENHATLRDLTDLGLSCRQVDYWTRHGLLRAHNPDPGCGRRRTWPADEVAVAAVMVRLVDAGLTPEAAHRAARHGGVLAPGVSVHLAESA